jgi:hypothetical protein
MNERIKELAEQAGAGNLGLEELDKYIDLERFAELVRQDEREACATLCDEAFDYFDGDTGSLPYAAFHCSKAIRRRTE